MYVAIHEELPMEHRFVWVLFMIGYLREGRCIKDINYILTRLSFITESIALSPYPNQIAKVYWAGFPVFYHCWQVYYPLPTSDFPASSIPNVKVTSAESIIAIKAGVSRAIGKVPFTSEV